MATSGCLYDLDRGQCRGPCESQFATACSPGCIADPSLGGALSDDVATSQGDLMCIDSATADCDAFEPDSCPIANRRCQVRDTPYDCPFSECGRGSPCADNHVCFTSPGGFRNATCCTAIHVYCLVSGDEACFDNAVLLELAVRFNCTRIQEDDQLGDGSGSSMSSGLGGDGGGQQDGSGLDVGGGGGWEETACFGDDALYDQTVCQGLSNCTWRALQGTGSGDAASVDGHCDDVQCRDYADQESACNAHGCSYANGVCDPSNDDTGSDTPGTDGPAGSGGSGVAGAEDDDPDPVDCFSMSDSECIVSAECTIIAQTYIDEEGTSQLQRFCILISCGSQQSESACTSFDRDGQSCTWTGEFCARSIGGDDEGDTGASGLGSSGRSEEGDGDNGDGGCGNIALHNRTVCEAVDSCIWQTIDSDLDELQSGYCDQLRCQNMLEQSGCDAADACTWNDEFEDCDDTGGSSPGSGAVDPEGGGGGGNELPCSDGDLHEEAACLVHEACAWTADAESGVGFCETEGCDNQRSAETCAAFSINCSWVTTIYSGDHCLDTNGRQLSDDANGVNLTAYTIQCELFGDAEACNGHPFCRHIEGGPGCRALDVECVVEDYIGCSEYAEAEACVQQESCVFDEQSGTCDDVTTTPRPTMLPFSEICLVDQDHFVPDHVFYPDRYLGRLGQFACGQVYSTGLLYLSFDDVWLMLADNCCEPPATTALSTTPPPATSAPTSPPPSTPPPFSPPPPTTPPPTFIPPVGQAAPTAGPTVNGGSTLDVVFQGRSLSALTPSELATFSFSITYQLAQRMGIDADMIHRVELTQNTDPVQIIARALFAGSITDAEVLAARTIITYEAITVSVGGETFTSSVSSVQVDATRRPTASPLTSAPVTAPSTPPPTDNGGNSGSSSGGEGAGTGVSSAVLIIVVVVILLVAIAIAIAWKRSQTSGVKHVGAGVTNPMYQAGIIGEDDADVRAPKKMSQAMQEQARKQKGLVNADSFC